MLQMTHSNIESDYIIIKSNSDIRQFSNTAFEKKALKLIVKDLDFNSDAYDLFKETKNINLITEIEFNSIEYDVDELNAFLNLLSYNKFKKLRFKNLSLHSDITMIIFSSSLEELEIVNCDDAKSTIESIDLTILKHMKSLTVSSVDISKETWLELLKKWTKSEIFLNLRLLDFSDSNINIDALSLLPYEKESALEVLRLNAIDLRLENIFKPLDLKEGQEIFYEENFKPLKLTSKYFNKLKHFEFINAFNINKRDDAKEDIIYQFYENNFFEGLDYFRGPRPYNYHNKMKLGQIFSSPFQTKKVPIDIDEIEMISGLLKSESLQNYEEITFYGSTLKIEYISILLAKMTKLRKVNLIRLNTNEFELENLISTFPKIEFYIQNDFKKGPQVYPKWADEDEDISY